jgi:hypothetical protein
MEKTPMTPEQEYRNLYERMAQLCAEQEWGDPFSYARSKEIYAAIALGHRVAPDYSGADAINEKEEEVEYKSTIANRCKGAYTGVMKQSTWAQQERYLVEEKIVKYPEHYFNRFEGGRLVESWRLTGHKVYDILRPKLQRCFNTTTKKKDPRLSANVCWTEIKNHGVQIIKNGKRVK